MGLQGAVAYDGVGTVELGGIVVGGAGADGWVVGFDCGVDAGGFGVGGELGVDKGVEIGVCVDVGGYENVGFVGDMGKD